MQLLCSVSVIFNSIREHTMILFVRQKKLPYPANQVCRIRQIYVFEADCVAAGDEVVSRQFP